MSFAKYSHIAKEVRYVLMGAFCFACLVLLFYGIGVSLPNDGPDLSGSPIPLIFKEAFRGVVIVVRPLFLYAVLPFVGIVICYGTLRELGKFVLGVKESNDV